MLYIPNIISVFIFINTFIPQPVLEDRTHDAYLRKLRIMWEDIHTIIIQHTQYSENKECLYA